MMGRMGVWALTAVLPVLLIVIGASSDGAMATERSGLAPVLVRDFLAPLKSLPPQRGFAESGRLGFGPGGLRVYPPHNRLIVRGRGRIEASGALASRSGDARHLRWMVTSRLDRVNRQGSSIGFVKSRRQFVSTVAAFNRRQFGFGNEVSQGLYRLTVSFEDNRRTLGTFKEYFRVARAHSDLSLEAPDPEVGAGEDAILRVKNLGTFSASYDAYPRLYAPDGVQVPVAYGIAARLRPRLMPGYLSPPITLPLPENLPAGEYEVQLGAKDQGMSARMQLSTMIQCNPD